MNKGDNEMKTDNKIITTKDSKILREVKDLKPRFDLLLPKDQKYENTLLYRFALHMSKGAKKYSSRNWEGAHTEEDLESFKSSAFRHFVQWMCDEKDEDHVGGILFNLMASEYVKDKLKPQHLNTSIYCNKYGNKKKTN